MPTAQALHQMPTSIEGIVVPLPRNRYQKLIARLYEAMIMLWIEQPIQGPHITANHDNISLIASRRRFMTGLAYICDWDKGGSTTTSIAVQDSEDTNTFWVASNEGFERNSRSGTPNFLRESLQRLQSITQIPDPNPAWLARQSDHCARFFTIFAAPRIKKEASLLSRMATSCIQHLNGLVTRRGNVTDTGTSDSVIYLMSITNELLEARSLERWLHRFQSRETLEAYDICMEAYNARNDPQMDTLRRLSQEVLSNEDGESLAKASRGARHFVGRLAEHIRVSKQLVEDALRAREVLDVFQASEIPTPLCVQPPEIDPSVTLDRILGRMIPKDDEELSSIRQGLSSLNSHVGLEERVKERLLALQSNPPIVHCEVQVLDHFHKSRLRFVGDDRFVGTSKVSCLCCKLYYRHHPSRPVEPDSHEQIYLNWGPVGLLEGPKDASYRELRETLNPVIHGLRDGFFRAMRNKGLSNFNHPNSITGLTRSADTPVNSDSDVEVDSEPEGGTTLKDS
ncbi:hypothetical protein FOXG_21625 [Fusarium oxysporum f. sp. lycopersici 4287]|uniref:Uncharacterized protein n=1 Tax=Fusarium oxysporum f. sp. lycopersici (strain 4287 / CBS 123668 / FGSC 9935 / NRRL 34936) TaxID=426428 RepID=A0A0J9VZV0_FUSO4|nr:hypothetical protein FOXG_21625 [Fusarium oxysporum f. sp. lycopersici 4287]KNB16333.1 hypothetical protein FOXG_21625 [Fusarium oxysporum f. sp. lycopersici 4287]